MIGGWLLKVVLTGEEDVAKVFESALDGVEGGAIAHGDGAKGIGDAAEAGVEDARAGAAVGAGFDGERGLDDGGDELGDFELFGVDVVGGGREIGRSAAGSEGFLETRIERRRALGAGVGGGLHVVNDATSAHAGGGDDVFRRRSVEFVRARRCGWWGESRESAMTVAQILTLDFPPQPEWLVVISLLLPQANQSTLQLRVGAAQGENDGGVFSLEFKRFAVRFRRLLDAFWFLFELLRGVILRAQRIHELALALESLLSFVEQTDVYLTHLCGNCDAGAVGVATTTDHRQRIQNSSETGVEGFVFDLFRRPRSNQIHLFLVGVYWHDIDVSDELDTEFWTRKLHATGGALDNQYISYVWRMESGMHRQHRLPNFERRRDWNATRPLEH